MRERKTVHRVTFPPSQPNGQPEYEPGSPEYWRSQQNLPHPSLPIPPHYQQQNFGGPPQSPPPVPPTTRSPMPDNFKPNLIASVWACVGIVVGSLGPWMTFFKLSKAGVDEAGVVTIVLALCAGVALVTLLSRGVTPDVKNHRIGPLVGLAVAVIAGWNAADILQRTTDILGTSIGPSVGWGLWMVGISGVVLLITSSTVGQLIRAHAKD
ncbi:hypothetical protein BDB13_4599 [Rhodococcus sp. OK302]|nr:hypothetical protein BDB13_4599 [Rhodococcus sp. OK302]